MLLFYRDDYDLGANEMLLLDKTTGIILKLDRTHSRRSQLPLRDETFDLEFMEIFRLKWDLLEEGFWDTTDDQDEK